MPSYFPKLNFIIGFVPHNNLHEVKCRCTLATRKQNVTSPCVFCSCLGFFLCVCVLTPVDHFLVVQSHYPGSAYHYHHSGQAHHANYHASYSFSSELRQPSAYKDMYSRTAGPTEQVRRPLAKPGLGCPIFGNGKQGVGPSFPGPKSRKPLTVTYRFQGFFISTQIYNVIKCLCLLM